MKRTRLRVTASARRAAATVGAVLCAMAVAAVATTDGTGLTGGPAPRVDDARQVSVAATETGLVCPTPAELEQPDVGDDEFSAAPVATATSLTTAVLDPAVRDDPAVSDDAAVRDDAAGDPPSVTRLDGSTTDELTGPLEQGDAGAVRTGDLVAGARMLRVTPDDATYAAGTVASVTTEGDLRGMVAGPCAEPAVEHWLVGGSTSVGSSGRLVLQNPGQTPATVKLEAWGASGPVALGSQSVVVVPPGEQTVTMLEAVAPDQGRLALHVTAEGGRVGAYVQHHRIDGLVPAGADLVTAGGAPARSAAVSGVVSIGEAVDDEHAPRLDLLAPGTTSGTAHLSVLGPDGPVRLRGGEEVDLEAGRVTVFPLGGLPEGTYTVVADADVPLVVGAGLDRKGSPADDAVIDEDPYDRAWLVGQEIPAGGPVADGAVATLEDSAYVVTLSSVPGAREPDQLDAADGSSAVTLRGIGPDGAEAWTRDVDVPAGTTVEVGWSEIGELDDAVAVVVEQQDGPSGVVWSVRLADADDSSLFSVLAPTPPLAAGGDVQVRRVDAVG